MTGHEGSRGRRPGRSLFGPIILITVGVFFLLRNVGLLPALNWQAALRLWPLLLVFLGLNVIVRQVSRPVGTVLSGLVAVAAIATFSFLLLAGDRVPLASRIGGSDLRREQISFPAEEVSEGRIDIFFSSFAADVSALGDSGNLIEGVIVHRGQVLFDTEMTGGKASVSLETRREENDAFFWLDPTNWLESAEAGKWEIGLNRRVPLDLFLDLSSGSTDLDLAALTLEQLEVNAGSGSTELSLSPGEYETRYDAGSGSTRITLPASGRLTLEVEGGSGSLTFFLPAEMAAMIEVIDGGSGSFNPGDRFTQTETRDGEEGTWETGGYEDAANHVTIRLNIGSGSVRVRQP